MNSDERRKPLKWPLIAIAAICLIGVWLITSWNAHSIQITWEIDNPTDMETILEDRIPVGSAIAEARGFMESEGFVCRDVSNGTFTEKEWFGDEEPQYDDISFVRCWRSQRVGFFKRGIDGLVMSHNWEVALVHDGSVITDVLVSYYLDGM